MTNHCNRPYVNKIWIFSFCLKGDVKEDLKEDSKKDVSIKKLETAYFAKHTNLFPVTGECYFISLLVIYLSVFFCTEGFCVMVLVSVERILFNELVFLKFALALLFSTFYFSKLSLYSR